MGEMDEKPIESEQTTAAAVSSFGHGTGGDDDRLKLCPAKDGDEEAAKDQKRLGIMEKELANAKLELEAKNSAHKQAILKLESQQKTTDELTILLKQADFQKSYYINECQEANSRADELKLSMDRMARHLSESQNAHDQLTSARADLADSKTALAVLEMVKAELTSQVEEMRSALSEEKTKGDELFRQVSDTKEAIEHLKSKSAEVEREKADALSAKEAELESANERLKTMNDLEAQVAEKSVQLVSLQRELEEVNELHVSTKRAASETIYEVKSLRENIEIQEKVKSEQAAYIGLLEAELEGIKTELGRTNVQVVQLSREVEDMKNELEKSKEKENDDQVEIALLKFELHKGRSKLAAAEAAEARAQTDKLALYNALQQMGLEAEETKKENRELKQAMQVQCHDKEIHLQEANQVDKNEDQKKDVHRVEECKHKNSTEVAEEEHVKKELEMAMAKMGELRMRVEQATSRAEAAEKAKAAMEEKMTKRKEHKEKRKAALAALREESITREFGTGGGIKYEGSSSPKHYQPLSKVLNMKF